MNLTKLVSDLPEIYQPIFGHPELSPAVSRQCDDRLEKISETYHALEKLLGRPLNVLDLGCAQGFFSFSLAKLGANVVGVDYLDKNVFVCRAIADENPNLNVEFHVGRIEEFVQQISEHQFDLVLGLSVFHHIVYEHGVPFVQELLGKIAQKSGALITELALRQEPLYWGDLQPEEPRRLLDHISFVHQIKKFATHLSMIERPLFVASDYYWLFGSDGGVFDSWSEDSHKLANGTHHGSRRYYFSENFVIKWSVFNHFRGEHNKSEFIREVSFLENIPVGFDGPKLLVAGKNETEGWTVVERIPGHLLLDLLRDKAEIDVRRVLLDLLKQLAALEHAGLYHDDVRAWNILVSDSGKSSLIDFGSISPKKADCVWPDNIFLSFNIFVRELLTGIVDNPVPLRTAALSHYGLPEPYNGWLAKYWDKPFVEWSFQSMYQTLLVLPAEQSISTLDTPEGEWKRAVEDGLSVQTRFMNHLMQRIDQVGHQLHNDLLVQAQQAEAASSERLAQLQAVYASSSWRLTKPLRAIKRILGGDFSVFQKLAAAFRGEIIQTVRPPVLGRCLFVDVSDIVAGDKRTGIQRVVRNILACLISAPPDGYSVYPVYALPNGQGYSQARFEFNGVSISVHPELKFQQLEFIEGDIFLGLDFACSQVTQSKSYLNRLSSIGVKVYFVLYDILPVRMPNFFPKDVHKWHAKWLRDIAEFDGVIAISNAVSVDYAKWLNENELEKLHCKISHFHLGADIDVSEENGKSLSKKQDEILRLFANRVAFLMVGTIEPRKGQEQVLSAFELLWQQQVDVALVIVGKEGWETEALINRIRNNKYLNTNLFWLPGIDDMFLKKIYATAKCLIAASLGEGFGLPLIEAAQHKLPIIARDIPIFREVAGGYAYYFSGGDPHGMASEIRNWLELYAEDTHPKSNAMQWLTWRKSTDELMRVVLD